jgi:hypothetical protein
VLGKEIAHEPLVYTTPDKRTARTYQEQAKWMKDNPAPEGLGERRKALMSMPLGDQMRNKGLTNTDMEWFVDRSIAQAGAVPRIANPLNNEGIVEMSIPHDALVSKIRENPELMGEHGETLKTFNPQTYKEIADSSVVLEGGVDPQHIKGSRNFKGVTAREVMDYAAKYPKRFAGGLGIAAAGTAGLSLAGNRIHAMLSRNGEQEA